LIVGLIKLLNEGIGEQNRKENCVCERSKGLSI